MWMAALLDTDWLRGREKTQTKVIVFYSWSVLLWHHPFAWSLLSWKLPCLWLNKNISDGLRLVTAPTSDLAEEKSVVNFLPFFQAVL